ncbi:unnamed protein product [Citrullus colocynthis]|uniref:Uncharacterized protein n=1 Tax=Citrullus colocynthis TaxID=252529 RepID=A0ABP0YDJ6_9ROSI
MKYVEFHFPLKIFTREIQYGHIGSSVHPMPFAFNVPLTYRFSIFSLCFHSSLLLLFHMHNTSSSIHPHFLQFPPHHRLCHIVCFKKLQQNLRENLKLASVINAMVTNMKFMMFLTSWRSSLDFQGSAVSLAYLVLH